MRGSRAGWTMAIVRAEALRRGDGHRPRALRGARAMGLAEGGGGEAVDLAQGALRLLTATFGRLRHGWGRVNEDPIVLALNLCRQPTIRLAGAIERSSGQRR